MSYLGVYVGGYVGSYMGAVYVATPTIREALFGRLSSNTAIAALVGDRIYPAVLPRKPTLPALTFYLPSRSGGHNLGGANGTSLPRATISAFAYDPGQAERLDDAVFACLDSFRGSWGGLTIDRCLFDNAVEIPNPPLAGTDRWIYQISSDYMIQYQTIKPNSGA